MTQEFPDLDITMVGMPDAVFSDAKGNLVLIDYKTAGFKGLEDPFMPTYETQLLGYAQPLQHLVLLTGLHSNNPNLTACCSDRSCHTAADCWIWQSGPLRIKWQDWIARGGRIIVHWECRQ
jgi:hypothetical protein